MSYQLGNIRHLRFWANKVLPLVYDESLSYYECICKIMDAINHLIEVEDLQNNAITDLDNRATSLEGRMTTAEGDIDAVENRATALENRATSLEGRMTTAEGDIDSLEGRMNTAESDIDAVENRATALENRATSLEGRMSTAESDIDAVENRATALESRATNLEGRMTTAEGDIDNLESDMTTAQGDITALQGRATALETRATNLEGRMTTAEGDIDSLENDMTTAQGDITALQGRATNLEGRMSTAEGDITTAQGDITALQGRATNLEGRMTTAEGDIDNLENDMATAQGDITALQGRATNLEGRMTTAEGDIDSLQAEMPYKVNESENIIDYVAIKRTTELAEYNQSNLAGASTSGLPIDDPAYNNATGYGRYDNILSVVFDSTASTFFTQNVKYRRRADGEVSPIYFYYINSIAPDLGYTAGMGDLGAITVVYAGTYNGTRYHTTEQITSGFAFTPKTSFVNQNDDTVYVTAMRFICPNAWLDRGMITFTSNYPSGKPPVYHMSPDESGASHKALWDKITAILAQIGNFTVVKTTQAQYDAITTPDDNTVYLIVG